MSRASSCPRRRALRVAAVAAPMLALSLLPAAAFAAPADDTPGHDHPLGVANSLLIFLVAPVGVFLLVALLTLRPGSAPKAQRYRPGRDWSAAPTWTGVQPPAELGTTAPHAAEGEPVMLPSGGSNPHTPVMAGTPHQEHASTGGEHAAAAEAEHPSAASAPAPVDDAPPPATGGSSGSW